MPRLRISKLATVGATAKLLFSTLQTQQPSTLRSDGDMRRPRHARSQGHHARATAHAREARSCKCEQLRTKRNETRQGDLRARLRCRQRARRTATSYDRVYFTATNATSTELLHKRANREWRAGTTVHVERTDCAARARARASSRSRARAGARVEAAICRCLHVGCRQRR